MNGEQIASLEEIFRVVFELPEAREPKEVVQADEPKWDSAAHVSLVIALESEFDVEIDPAEAMRLTSFQEAVTVLEEKGV